MHFISMAALAAVAATQAAAQYDTQSPPFNLILLSDNSTINGSALFPCHEGAAIEGLCPDYTATTFTVNKTLEVYNFNYSATATGDDIPGALTWFLPLGGDINGVSSAMQLDYNPTSNVAVPLFFPGSGQGTTSVAFDECGKMYIIGYVDDATNPPTPGKITRYYRWYVCLTEPTSYLYTTLAWVMGSREPQNPSCQKVDVKRVFV